jgi:hypothetical protein
MGQLQAGERLPCCEQLQAAVMPAVGGIGIAQQGLDLLGDGAPLPGVSVLIGRFTGSRQMIRPGRP